MSRVGKQPIEIPKGVKVNIAGDVIDVKGDKGNLKRTIPGMVRVEVKDNQVLVSNEDNSKNSRSRQGLVRSLVYNMVMGVAEGFKKNLEIKGVGYRAEVKGKDLQMNLGFSHPVHFPIPEGISAEVDKNNNIEINGIDKELVGLTAARIRAIKPPDAYKGKGIRYAEELVRTKAGKAGTT